MIKPLIILKKKKTYLAAATIIALAIIIIKKAVIPATDTSYHNFEEIKKRGVLVIAVQNDPMSMYVSENDTSGFAYSILKDFAKEKNLCLEIKTANTLEEEINLLELGGCNIIADLIPHTAMTKEKVNLSIPVCISHAVLIQNMDSKSRITRHTQIAGRTITIPKNSPYRTRITNMQKEVQDSVFIHEERGMNTLDIINSMKVSPEALTVCSNHQAEFFKNIFPYITSMKIGFCQKMSIATGIQTDNLSDSINTWLASYMESKRFRELEKQYISKK